MTQQYMEMTSRQIRDVFDVPRYENLESLDDQMLEEEEKRLRMEEGTNPSIDTTENVLEENTGRTEMLTVGEGHVPPWRWLRRGREMRTFRRNPGEGRRTKQ